MHRIRVCGKQGKGVTVLFEPEDWKLLNNLLHDDSCKNNRYLFQNRQHKPMKSHELLRELSDELELEKPAAIRYVLAMFFTY